MVVPLVHAAKVLLIPPESEVPPPPVTQVVPMAKQPVVREIPFANVEEAVVEVASIVPACKRSAWMPPESDVDVAVVVAVNDPKVTAEERATMRVPSKERSPVARDDAFVPPFAIPRIPVISLVNEMSELAIAPTVALRKPEMFEIVNPPAVMLRPPAMVLVAVPVALMLPVWRLSTWRPPLSEVEVAVPVAISWVPETGP